MGELFWLYVVLVKIPVANADSLRGVPRGTLKVRTRIIACARVRGRQPKGDFGICCVSVHPRKVAMVLAWNMCVPGRGKHRTTREAPIDGHIVVGFKEYCVLARSFRDQADAKRWVEQRLEIPVPT